jgi:hypothetical protein
MTGDRHRTECPSLSVVENSMGRPSTRACTARIASALFSARVCFSGFGFGDLRDFFLDDFIFGTL